MCQTFYLDVKPFNLLTWQAIYSEKIEKISGLFLVSRKCNIISILKKYHDVKDKKRIEVSLKVIERIHSKNPEIQKLIDESMIDVCKEEIVSPKLDFFFFFCFSFAFVFTIMGYPNIIFLFAK